MRLTLPTCFMLIPLSTPAFANEPQPPLPRSAAVAAQAGTKQQGEDTLAAVLGQLLRQRGIDFSLAPDLAADRVPSQAEHSGSALLQKVLQGYNYALERDSHGAMTRIIITGRNGDGTGSAPSGAAATVSRTEQSVLPERLRGLPPGAASSVDFALQELFNVPLGGKTAVDLPTGRYAVVHDNVFEHPNGDRTWVGYLDGEGTDYRMIVTLGRDGATGQILTPQGLFRIEAESGRSWLIDVAAADLRPQTMLGDDVFANAVSRRKRRPVVIDKLPEPGSVTGAVARTSAAGLVANSAPKVTIDLLAYYSPGFSNGAATTRLNQVVASANQAYVDSQVNINLRLVFAQKISYSETVSNETALNDLTNSRGLFTGVAALRSRYGADLVTLLRPFKYSTQGNCGIAWVNGGGGTAQRANLGFSVVSDGRDASANYYCTDLSLAHELGHNMGSVHDRAHSGGAGKYAYSYGHGKSGVFGTVMSYYNPQLGMFSNPATLCKGQPCGIAVQADNARSLNQTAATIAGFAPTVVR